MLFSYPFSEPSITELSFLGAFSELDFLLEATLESPFQAVFSTYMAVRKLQLHRGGRFPVMIFISLIASVSAVYESYCHLRRRQDRENVGDYGRMLEPKDGQYISFIDAVWLTISAGRGWQYSHLGSPLEDGQLDEVVAALHPPSTLRSIRFESCDMDDAAAQKLFEVLPKSTVRVLTLRFNDISNVDALAAAFENGPIEEVVLSFNDISNIDSLCKSLVSSNCSLQMLSLRHNTISSVDGVAKALEVNHSLRKLTLRECGIIHVDSLGLALLKNRTVEFMNLSNNKISDIGVLGQALAANSVLRELRLDNNLISNVDGFCKGLVSNTVLKVLKMDCNRISDVRMLGHMLAENTSLEELSMAGNKISDVEELAEGLMKNATLCKLDLWGNHIEDSSRLQGIQNARQTLKKLVVVLPDEEIGKEPLQRSRSEIRHSKSAKQQWFERRDNRRTILIEATDEVAMAAGQNET
eukprot:TRINITY_DN24349_c0_g2_i2.p1 TRINITY_DN24349_c0_g2~~TRINITY_DN24349_c0_g2_i2.p1  ORF type:complete len:469 (-),score=64.73 TRINITY_DN24349_c0_g2_i2:492-1898(-)